MLVTGKGQIRAVFWTCGCPNVKPGHSDWCRHHRQRPRNTAKRDVIHCWQHKSRDATGSTFLQLSLIQGPDTSFYLERVMRKIADLCESQNCHQIRPFPSQNKAGKLQQIKAKVPTCTPRTLQSKQRRNNVVIFALLLHHRPGNRPVCLPHFCDVRIREKIYLSWRHTTQEHTSQTYDAHLTLGSFPPMSSSHRKGLFMSKSQSWKITDVSRSPINF